MEWSTIAPLLIQIPFVLLMAYILDKQAKMGVEVVKFLMTQFETITQKQADRHKEMTDSLLGLIDEVSARTTPDNLNAKQIAMMEKYIKSQAEQSK